MKFNPLFETVILSTPSWDEPTKPRDTTSHRSFENNWARKQPAWRDALVEYLRNNGGKGKPINIAAAIGVDVMEIIAWADFETWDTQGVVRVKSGGDKSWLELK